MSDFVVSAIRTYAPIAVGLALTFLAREAGVVVDTDTEAGLTAGLVGLLSAAWYALARWLESRWPALGWMLGAPKAPTYEPRKVRQ